MKNLFFALLLLPFLTQADPTKLFYTIEKTDDTSFEISARDYNNNQYGYISISLPKDTGLPGVISHFRVEKPFQKQGIGSQLFIHGIRKFYHSKINTIVWHATSENIPFYKRFGAEILQQNELDMLVGGDALMVYQCDALGDPEKNLHHYNSRKI